MIAPVIDLWKNIPWLVRQAGRRYRGWRGWGWWRRQKTTRCLWARLLPRLASRLQISFRGTDWRNPWWKASFHHPSGITVRGKLDVWYWERRGCLQMKGVRRHPDWFALFSPKDLAEHYCTYSSGTNSNLFARVRVAVNCCCTWRPTTTPTIGRGASPRPRSAHAFPAPQGVSLFVVASIAFHASGHRQLPKPWLRDTQRNDPTHAWCRVDPPLQGG
jgi:hypothetical protein